jgi:predicted HNH restriction endonuclease
MPRSSRPYYWLANGISRLDIQRAAAEIDRNGVPPRLQSRSFDVIVGSKVYPAKHDIRLAAKNAKGTQPLRFHAHQAVECLRTLGYRVIDRKVNTQETIAIEDDELAFPEGRERYRQHRILEWDPTISKKAKNKRLETTGKLECDVCKFDFDTVYSELGKGFIESHHTVPVSALAGKTRT